MRASFGLERKPKEMKIASVLLLVFFFCSFFTSSRAHMREKRNSQAPASEITVSLKIDWNVSVVGKEVPASYVSNVQNGTVLVDILNKAAEDNKLGPFNKYDSTYYGGIGYYITAMSGTQENSTTGYYWLLFDEQSGVAVPCGVSSYVPVNQSSTIFRYTATFSSHNDTVTGYCKTFLPLEQVPPSAITVTLEMDWNITSVGKPIPASYTTQVAKDTVLVDIMNKAANENKNGPYNRWTTTYYGGLGNLISSMNGTEQDPGTGTYWIIYDKATGEPIPLGIDSYKPQDDSTTIFRLGTGNSHEEATPTATTRPSVLGPSSSRPSVLGPSYSHPSVLEPSSSRPSVLEPSSSRPSVLEPSSSRPSVLGPSSSPGKLVEADLVTMFLLAGIEALLFL